MKSFFSKTLIAILFSFLISGTAFAQSCSSLKEIFENSYFCDAKSVSLAGTVYGEPIMHQGSKYTYEFQIIDSNNNVIRIISTDSIVLINGNTVTINGKYYKGIYDDGVNLNDTVIASSDNIKVTLTAAELWNDILEPYKESLDKGTTLASRNEQLTIWNEALIAITPLFSVVAFYFGLMFYKRRQMKGISFEGYVEGLFSKQDWRLAESNAYRKHNRWIESNSNPDFIFIHRKTNKKIAIECKYKPERDTIFWAYEDQIAHYQSFSDKGKIPVFVVIGMGGRPKNPKRFFLIPLSAIKYPDVKLEYLKNFERDSKTKFSIDKNGHLI